MAHSEHITYFAETDYRGRRIKFGIKDADRAKHMYVIGKTGMGKSTLLENLAIQDIQNGNGIGFIDPHGSSAETLLDYIPEHRIKDVIYFAPFDQEHPIAFNVMEDIGKDQRPLVASGLLGSFKKVWVDAWSPRMEYLLNNALLALLEYPNSTLLGVNRMFADKDYRKAVVAHSTDPSVKSFWNDEFAKYNERYATEAAAAIQNKVGQFAANPLIRNMMGQPKSSFNIRDVMDKKKIFIANLSKGRIGEGNASLIGGMLITKLYLAAMSRADMSPDTLSTLPPFYLFVDEFQSFANESFADILSEARKYRLSLTIAHQYIEQMSDEVRAAVFGNVGTMMSFRVGAYDAEVLEKEFAPSFMIQDIVSLGFAQVYLKLMIDGIGSAPFSARTLNRPERPAHSFREEVIASSRAQFSRDRSSIEADITKWHAPIVPVDTRPRTPRVVEGGGAPSPSSGVHIGTPTTEVRKNETSSNGPAPLRQPLQHLTPKSTDKVFSKPLDKPKVHSFSPEPKFQSEKISPEITAPMPIDDGFLSIEEALSDTDVSDEKIETPIIHKKAIPTQVVEEVKKYLEKTPNMAIVPKAEIIEPQKLVTASLAKLGSKSKSPSAQNLSSLREALQSVMAKQTPLPGVQDVTTPKPNFLPTESLPNTDRINRINDEMKKKDPHTTKSTQDSQEVPEDVLLKVLE